MPVWNCCRETGKLYLIGTFCDNLLSRGLVGDYVEVLLTERIYGIVHGYALARILMVLVDDRLTSELTDTHDAVSVIHTILLN